MVSKINAVRPDSVHCKRHEDDNFYMSKAVNEYFTDSFMDYAKKVKILQAKLKCRGGNLQKTMNKVKNKDNEERYIVNQ